MKRCTAPGEEPEDFGLPRNRFANLYGGLSPSTQLQLLRAFAKLIPPDATAILRVTSTREYMLVAGHRRVVAMRRLGLN